MAKLTLTRETVRSLTVKTRLRAGFAHRTRNEVVRWRSLISLCPDDPAAGPRTVR
jgi:hypothetical protein